MKPALHNMARPPWPEPTVLWLLGSPGAATRLRVLDLGSGTGSGTREAAALGHRVLAVDPSAGMLSVLEGESKRMPAHIGARITSAMGSAEHLPCPDRSVDALLCLQAWQWVSPPEAAHECLRVLVPGGSLAMAWHTWDRSVPWVRELAAIVDQPEPSLSHGASLPRGIAGLGGFEQREFRLDFELTVDRLVQLADSWTYVRRRPDRAAVLERIRSLGNWQAGGTGRLTFPHLTECYRALKLSETQRSHHEPPI